MESMIVLVGMLLGLGFGATLGVALGLSMSVSMSTSASRDTLSIRLGFRDRHQPKTVTVLPASIGKPYDQDAEEEQDGPEPDDESALVSLSN